MARSKKLPANSKPARATDDEEAVGYCKPPKAHQFKPGRSGNPKGRPKKKGPTARELMAEFASETIPIKRGGRVENVPRWRAFQEKLFQEAMSGNTAAGNLLVKLMSQAGQFAAPESEEEQRGGVLAVPMFRGTEEDWENLPNEQVVKEGACLRKSFDP